ncbi:ABC transporter ATP-binding protein [Solirubrobacter soli]|uniref:ABC transporter ATP-binding protein n=1 Tax=Solirubrobacter soli TaxID=363832 RepID=UPI0003F904CB|nr:ATP-binding cassette domain-containing protein [Solirubrobacter soli]
MTAALALEDLHAEVPDGDRARVLLDGLNFVLAPGELVVVTGASGSGKSTLLTYAGLLRRPARGEVLVAGMPTARLRERARTAARREHMALVYQSANLLPSLTAREQLELVAHVRGERGRAARRRADELLTRVQVAHRADALPAQLSGGERQRVGVARALMGRPTVLLADEPTASLDPDLSAEIARLLASAAREDGVATLVVSHDDAPLAYADRHLRLIRGGLVSG